MLDLPTELIRQICTDEDFDRHDLMALRLTCTLTCGFSTHLFDRECFHNISVLFTRRSLQALLDVSNHPRIGPQIQTVTFTPLRTFPEAFQSLFPTQRPIYHEAYLAKANASGRAIHQYLDRYYEEIELKQSGDADRLLTDAFVALRKFDHSLCLKISDEEETHIGAHGCLTGAQLEKGDEANVFKLHWTETMGYLIKAVTDSGCRVARLSLENLADAGLVGEGKLWTDDLDDDVNRLSASLVAFDVDVQTFDPDIALKLVKQVVSQAKNPNTLSFQRFDTRLYYDLAGFSDSVASNSLKAITISNFYCPLSDLISFLSKHKSTLVHLSITCTRLKGSWESLIQWIISNLAFLRSFEMDDVADDGFEASRNYEEVPNCDFDETEDIPTALERLLTENKRHGAGETDETHPIAQSSGLLWAMFA
jgi:hypothetical protein